MKKIILSIVIFVSFVSCSFAQIYTDAQKEILRLQDNRMLGSGKKLLEYAKSDDPKTAALAVNALANIGDSNTVEDIGELLLESSITSVRSLSAFALGQIPTLRASELLSESLIKEKNDTVICSVLNALGKTGDETNLNSVCNYNANSPEIKKNQILSIARLAIRKIRNDNSVGKLIQLASGETNEDILKLIAYAVWRTADKQLLAQAKDIIMQFTNSANSDIRMWAFNALGRIADPDDLDYVLNMLKSESSWNTKVNIINTLPLYKASSENILDKKLIEALNIFTTDENSNVRIAVLSAFGKLFSNLNEKNIYLDDIRNILLPYFDTESELDWQEVVEAFNSYGMIFKDEAKDLFFTKFNSFNDYDIKPGIIKSFSYFEDASVLRQVRDSISADIKRYATKFYIDYSALIGSKDLAKLYRAYVELVSVLDDKQDLEDRNISRLVFSEFTGSKDPMLVSLSLTALKDTIYNIYREETSAILSFDFKDLKLPQDFDVMLLFIDAFADFKPDNECMDLMRKYAESDNQDIATFSAKTLEKLTGEKIKVLASRRTDYNWDMIEKLHRVKFATIYTDLGEIKFELYPQVAPFTVLNFYNLSERGFYNGTTFHRIVPNFVIQGGDPTNTGEGGPGYTIRSEFSEVHYEKGMVGMASNGKDTEGSQFFIMHSSHYHLDGRYTLFGKVVEGWSVVDNIQLGVTVEKITFSEN